jgi:transcriptional regulator with XRE-family HTH domain
MAKPPWHNAAMVTGAGLKKVRKRAGLTQAQAANLLNYSMDGYSKIERGERKMSAEFIKRAAEAFGCNPEEIIDSVADIEAKSLEQLGVIDPERLASFVSQAKDRLAALSEAEAKQLVLALISASRRP